MDGDRPTLNVAAPAGTSSASPTYVTGTTYRVSGTASDGSGLRSVTVNGATATISGNNWYKDISLSTGTATTVTVVATDKAGRTTTVTRYVYAYAVQDITSILTRTHNIQSPNGSGIGGESNASTRYLKIYCTRGSGNDGGGYYSCVDNAKLLAWSGYITSTGTQTVTIAFSGSSQYNYISVVLDSTFNGNGDTAVTVSKVELYR